MIEIKKISKSYKKGKKVISDIDLKIKDGEIFGFLGPNGAGKTTTIKMIVGILDIDEGDILIDGKSIKTNPIEAKKQIGFVSDNPDMFLKLKGIEYLNFIADIYEIDKETREKRIIELAKEFGIYEVLNDKIQSYSHGMRQKIIIISVLLHNPKNWILDEPLTGLDPEAAFYLKNKMKEHAKANNAVFFSTHILEIAEKLCDRIGIIHHGKLVFVGTHEEMKKELKENASLEELFMEITKRNEENI
ncbi:MAG: ABC transporter ATP-binding protein [Clostridia bacterium]|nr:ABC transporter ATP-binding protein [Clostridia bacterium]